jgi:LacI family transcriptional regulator
MTTTSPVRPATLHDVAREAGVSTSTASRVLNGSTRQVADAYRERVVLAAARLGYTANRSAQATVRGSAAAVTLLTANITDAYFTEIAEGVAHAADAAGLVLTIGITDRSPHREAALVRAAAAGRPRGIILAASRNRQALDPYVRATLTMLGASGTRLVTLGAPLDGIPCRTVSLDNRGGTRELGAVLARHGYRRALVLAAGPGLVTSDDRSEGFAAGFREAGGDDVEISRGSITRDSGHAQMRAALERGIRPGTVVFCISDVMAFGAMTAIREAGREIGDDIAIAGFGHIRSGRDIVPSLTTVRTPHERLGRLAVEAIVEDPWEPVAPLGVDVIMGASTPARR